MKKIAIIFFSLLLFFSFIKAENLIAKKKVFYINSYHSGLYWSDGIEKSIKETLLKSKIPIEFKRVEMNSKRNNNEPYKMKIAQKIKNQIENFKPDVIITSDDNAIKYVIEPYFKNSSIPIVFCGINGTIKKYKELPFNITGMEEVQLIPQLIDALKKYAKGNRIGSLDDDSFSAKAQSDFFEEQLKRKIYKKHARTIDEWKKYYVYLQNNTDILLLGNSGALINWDKNKENLEDFVKEETKIPTAAWDITVSKFVVLTFANNPEEQGRWAANAVLRILKGEDIKNIPIAINEKANIYINTTLSKKLNIVFPFELIDNAVLVK
ncbi:ABC transporter substrate-binding protein [Arcobacter sp. F2176]|uniref:ABC transporter substrate-binding protein n=1 Tax=Arcobacter sp. F2176 TaxID=2044511 RepID=UPI0013E93162|nr:ABC transporter substrate binding protein [Arcobacter sp. F2176]